jgi:hypothetical protein
MAIERAVRRIIVHKQDGQWRLRYHGDLLADSVTTLNQYRISNSNVYLQRSKSTGFTI